MLLVSGDNESIRIMGIDVQRAGNLAIEDLAEGRAGRLVIYTENAIRELEKRIEAKSEEGAKK